MQKLFNFLLCGLVFIGLTVAFVTNTAKVDNVGAIQKIVTGLDDVTTTITFSVPTGQLLLAIRSNAPNAVPIDLAAKLGKHGLPGLRIVATSDNKPTSIATVTLAFNPKNTVSAFVKKLKGLGFQETEPNSGVFKWTSQQATFTLVEVDALNKAIEEFNLYENLSPTVVDVSILESDVEIYFGPVRVILPTFVEQILPVELPVANEGFTLVLKPLGIIMCFLGLGLLFICNRPPSISQMS